MVDFNNDTTVTVAPAELIKIIILQRRHDFIEAQEHYFKFLSEDVETPVSLEMVLSRLRSFYIEIKGIVKRHWKEKETNDFETIFDRRKQLDIDAIIEKFMTLNDVLDEIGLLKIDNRRLYDERRVEQSNAAQKI